MADKLSLFSVRKRFLTILELIIAMSLAMVIITTLSFFYHQVSLINIEMDREQIASFEKLYLENRLANLLPRALSSTDQSGDFHFFTTPNTAGLFKPGTSSLIFAFDNCVQLDRNMTYHVIGRLFLNDEGKLTLAKWPSEKRWKEGEPPPVSKEVLAENVEDLKFSFFIPPERFGQKTEAENRIPPDIRGRWIEEWSKEFQQLPAIVKVEITQKNRKGKSEKNTYAFPLPHTINPIIYNE